MDYFKKCSKCGRYMAPNLQSKLGFSGGTIRKGAITMTENEVIKIATHCLSVLAEQEVCEEYPVYRESGIVCKQIARTVISALEEIQQYREIGTVEEIRVAYKSGYDAGYVKGYDDGYDAGYVKGYDDGYDAGYVKGYDDGYALGITQPI